MSINSRILEFNAEMTAWRHDFHAHPETAFEEIRTAKRVAELLHSFGIEVHSNLGRTGVVGVLRVGTGEASVGLRADMDALHVQEKMILHIAPRMPVKCMPAVMMGIQLCSWEPLNIWQRAGVLTEP